MASSPKLPNKENNFKLLQPNRVISAPTSLASCRALVAERLPAADLVGNVNAIALVLDHLLQASDLAFNALEAR